jgi:PilZ domain
MTKPTEIATDNVTLFPGSGQGTLTTPTGEEVPVRTFERGEEVVLVVLVNLDDERESDSVEAAKLEYTSRRGLIKLRGEAVFEDPSLIHFHPDGDAEILQRRDFVRVHAPRTVTVESETDGRRRVHTVDLSGGGMLLADDETLAVDQTIRFTMSIVTTELPIEGIARVVRIREDGKRALIFEQIADHDRQRLIRYVFECMRTARARTRGDLI